MAMVLVIATNWRCNSEMIQDGVTGIIYPGNNATTLKEAIDWMVGQMMQIVKIKESCLIALEYYMPNMHIKHIIDVVESD